MPTVVRVRKLVMLSTLVVPAAADAQVLDAAPSANSAGAAEAPSMEITTDPTVDQAIPQIVAGAGGEYATAIDGSGLINLEDQSPRHLALGGTFSTGWDSNPNNQVGGVSTALYTVAPYVALRADTPKLRALVQYQWTNTGFSSAYAKQSMHLGSIHLQRQGNERWSWQLDGVGRYGEDGVRFASSPQTVAVGGVAGTGPNAASYLPNAGKVTYTDDSFGASYRASERDSVTVRVGNAFSRYQGYAADNSIASTDLSYQHDVTPSLGVSVYQQNSFYYGALHCQSYGAGAGVRWRAREQTTISLSGGPQLDTASCGSQQGFAFNAALSSRLTGRSQVYLLAARQPTSSYLGPGVWQQNVSGGYQRQIRSRAEVSFDVGYVASSTLVRFSSYRGTYVDCVYSARLGRGMRAAYSYRGLLGDSGGLPFQRHVAQVSLSWAPGTGRLIQ